MGFKILGIQFGGSSTSKPETTTAFGKEWEVNVDKKRNKLSILQLNLKSHRNK